MRAKSSKRTSPGPVVLVLALGLVAATQVRANENVGVRVVTSTAVENAVPPAPSAAGEVEESDVPGPPSGPVHQVPFPFPLTPRVPADPAAGGRVVCFDLRTRAEMVVEPPHLGPGTPTAAFTKSGPGAVETLAGFLEIIGGKNFGDLSPITNPEVYPNCPNVKLTMQFPDIPDTIFHGSGVLIDSKHVLTAGHCIHEGDGGDWAAWVTLVPGYENGVQPFGEAHGLNALSWEGWTVYGDFDYDLGLIELDRPVGAVTGWHGYGYNNNDSFFEDNTFHNPGYPAEPPYSGEYMYTWHGTFDHTRNLKLGFDRNAFQGQSGSGAYYVDGSDRIVYAALSHESPIGEKTWDIRITSDRFEDIGNFISNHTPPSPDLVPLAFEASDAYVTAGDELSWARFVLHNCSRVSWNGHIHCDVYLSTNQWITSSDTHLGTQILVSAHLDPKESIMVYRNPPPTIPLGTPAGYYYLGVIVDVEDYDEDNNDTSADDAFRIYVFPGPPEPPSNCQVCVGGCEYLLIGWDDNSSDEDGFHLYRNNEHLDTVPPNTVSYVDTTVNGCQMYVYKVLAYNSHGNSDFSNTDSGEAPGPPSRPQNVQATTDDCDKIRITWDDVPSGLCQESQYTVYRASEVIAVVGANVTSYDYVPDPCTAGQFSVRASNACGESPLSSTAFGVRRGLADPPSGCVASDDLCDRVRITWTDESSGICGETGFAVFRDNVLLGTVGENVTEFEDLTAEPCETYSYKVRSQSGCGLSVGSARNPGTRLDAPDAPTDGRASDSNPLWVRVTWRDNSSGGCNESGFEIYRDGDLIVTVPADVTAYWDAEPLPCGIPHDYEVRAITGCGSSATTQDSGMRPCPPSCTGCPGHFAWTGDTGSMVEMLITDAESGRGPLSPCSEIAVYDGDLCVGCTCWGGDPVELVAWGDDPGTPEVDGYVCGHTMEFRIFNFDTGTIEYAEAAFDSGSAEFCEGTYAVLGITGTMAAVEDDQEPAWADRLSQNYPNPFNPETVIGYELSRPAAVRLSVFDVAGRVVRVLVDRVESAGPHDVGWDGCDDSGRPVSPGIYFYRLEAGGFRTMKKMVLVK